MLGHRIRKAKLRAPGALFLPLIAKAEPSVSGAHLPVLWLASMAVSGVLTWLILRPLRGSRMLRTSVRQWLCAGLLFVVLMLLLSPFLIVFGSILITGRTM
jgi:hypothetical protein